MKVVREIGEMGGLGTQRAEFWEAVWSGARCGGKFQALAGH